MTISVVNVIGTGGWFLGEIDSNGNCAHLSWLDDFKYVESWRAAGAPDVNFTFAQIASMSVDRLPHGDDSHVWARSEFRYVYATAAGAQGPQGPAGPWGPTGPQGPKGDPGTLPAEAKIRFV